VRLRPEIDTSRRRESPVRSLAWKVAIGSIATAEPSIAGLGHDPCAALGVLALQPTLLGRATQIVGGTEQLCEYLGVSEARLKLWFSGQGRLPDPIFLKAVDLILRDDIARAAHDRRRQARSDGTARIPRATVESSVR